MARRRRRRDNSDIVQRGDNYSTSLLLDELVRPATPYRRSSSWVSPVWNEVEDRRTWHPDGDERDVRDFDGIPVRVVEGPRKPVRVGLVRPVASRIGAGHSGGPRRVTKTAAPRFAFQFEVPASVVVCARRKERREVLFAKGKGRGRVGKVRKRTWMSEISCRG